MKTKERHHLKQNEFVETTVRVTEALREHRQRVGLIAAVLIAVVVIAAGVGYWRKQRADRAGELLGIAMATAYSQIAPASTLPGAVQPPGTYPTAAARGEAAIKAFDEVISQYPSTDEARAAAYSKASEQFALGRLADAETGFRAVMASAGSTIYGPLATIGLAETLVAAKKHDEAIRILADLSADRETALPIDGVLVQLARANAKAGKTADARAAFKRVADEFPESPYAAEAKQQLASLN